MQTFLVTRAFTGGVLQGLTHTAVTTVEHTEGQRVEKPIGGSPYTIVRVLPLSEAERIVYQAVTGQSEWSES